MIELHDVAQAHELMQARLAMPAGTDHDPAVLVLRSPAAGDGRQLETLSEQGRKVNILVDIVGESWGFTHTDGCRQIVAAMDSSSNTVSR